jgi:hypothetical protein
LGARAEVDARFDAVEQKFDARCGTIEKKLDARCGTIEDKLERKVDDLRAEMSRQFRWTIGTMVTLFGLTLTLGAGVATALLSR